MTEEAIIAKAARGDRAAFRALYDAHVGRVASQVGRMLGPTGDVEGVVQEVFIEVFRSLSGYRGESRFSTWLYGVTRNVIYAHLRHRTPQIDLVALRAMAAPEGPWGRLDARDKLKILYTALGSLSPEHQEAFVLYEIEGLALSEIATMTEVPLNTAAARVRRARERLRAVLEKADQVGSAAAGGGRA